MDSRRGYCFTTPPPAFLKCPICLQTLSSPVNLSSCSHVCCQDCFQTWFRAKNQCPVCRKSVSSFFPSSFASDVLENLQVHCPFGVEPTKDNKAKNHGTIPDSWRVIPGGCKHTMPIKDLSSHVRICLAGKSKDAETIQELQNEIQKLKLQNQQYEKALMSRDQNQLKALKDEVKALKSTHRVYEEAFTNCAEEVVLLKRQIPQLQDEYYPHNIYHLITYLSYAHTSKQEHLLRSNKVFDAWLKKLYNAWRLNSEDDLPAGYKGDLEALLSVAISTTLLTDNQRRKVEEWLDNVRCGCCAPP